MVKKAVIIGSGIAGIASAIRLSAAGYSVSVYEKNDIPGGKITAFTRDGFQFDQGPSLFTQPENIQELFSLYHENAADHIDFIKVENTCTYFFNNNKIVNAWSDIGRFHTELNNVGEKGDVSKYLARSSRLYNSVGNIFLNHSLQKRSTWFKKETLAAIKNIRLSYFRSLHKYNRNFFSSHEASQIFDRFATYNGSDPYRAPAMLSMIPHLEYNQGVYYPKGGLISVTHALYELAKRHGVTFHFNKAVKHIINNEGRAMGIVCEGENIMADVVVSNSDVYFTYKYLLSHPAKAKKIKARERSSSALIFYWSLSKKFSQTSLHNIFFSDQYEEEFKFLFNGKKPFTDHTVYLNVTSKLEEEHAPAGMENWFVMINVPAENGQNWTAIRNNARTSIIAKLEKLLGEEVEKYIISESYDDPSTIHERTGTYKGSLYGTSSNTLKAAFVRHPNFSRSIKNLYFCGGTVHPGGGIPLCLKSAKITAELIQHDLKPGHH